MLYSNEVMTLFIKYFKSYDIIISPVWIFEYFVQKVEKFASVTADIHSDLYFLF